MPDTAQQFGGDWTVLKLNCTSGYYGAYTTALKWQPSKERPFRLVYIDAFAGTGYVNLKSGHLAGKFVEGSAIRALKVDNKPFDELILVESDLGKAKSLEETASKFNRNVRVIRGDANDVVPEICGNLGEYDRAVVLFDPFSISLHWKTLETAADTRHCDVWYLFPLGDVRRDLTRHNRPERLSTTGQRLTTALGTDAWYDQYAQRAPKEADTAQQDEFWNSVKPKDVSELDLWESPEGTDWILRILRDSLKRTFGMDPVIVPELVNSRNVAMFSLVFATSNPNAVKLATDIARGAIKAALNEVQQIKIEPQQPKLL